MRDLETISIALTAAETGHLVFATLHTQDAPQTVDRVIDVFPTNQQQQVRVQLAGALQGVVCQQLVPTADGNGAGRRGRGHDGHPGRPQPHPRRQDPPGLLGHAGRRPATACRPWTSPWPTWSAAATSATSKALERCHHAEDFNRLLRAGGLERDARHADQLRVQGPGP